jgi:hypothetical protein
MISLSYQSATRPSQGRSNRSQGWFVLCDLMPAVIGAALAALVIGSQDIGTSLADFARLGTDDGWWPVDILLALIGAALYFMSWLLALPWGTRLTPVWLRSKNWRSPESVRRQLADLFWWTSSGALFGYLVALAAGLLAHYPDSRDHSLLVVVLGAPAILLAQIVTQIMFVGATSLRQTDDDDRQYLARAGGWYAAALTGWAVFMSLVFLGPIIAGLFGLTAAKWAWDSLAGWLLSAGGISGAITLVLGKSNLTSRNSTAQQFDAKAISLDLILTIATPIFASTLLITASVALDQLLFGKPITETMLFGGVPPPPSFTHWTDCPPAMLLFGLGTAIILVVLVPWRVNLNHFSLHALYRARLIRAVLSASQIGRSDRPNRSLFTGIDPSDNLPMTKLWDRYSTQRGERWRPFHVINMTLNIVSGRNLERSELKVEPFTVSPLHSGSGSRAFAGGKRGLGLSLGTAMAISGAAVNANFGYNVAPAVNFLMALFNARFGWWLPNPGPKGEGYHATDGPRWALGALVDEVFRTTDRRYVHLSDGRHYESLGLCEMVRRRCRFIVVSDAGCDPEFRFTDLGNAIRRIQIDLGVRIEMKGLAHLKKRELDRQRPDPEQRYYATGTIHYHEVDRGDSEDGCLLYIKAGLRWDEAPDILSYALAHPEFPHESTADQWFTESQFESYRHLGATIGSAILKNAGVEEACTWKEVCERLAP